MRFTANYRTRRWIKWGLFLHIFFDLLFILYSLIYFRLNWWMNWKSFTTIWKICCSKNLKLLWSPSFDLWIVLLSKSIKRGNLKLLSVHFSWHFNFLCDMMYLIQFKYDTVLIIQNFYLFVDVDLRSKNQTILVFTWLLKIKISFMKFVSCLSQYLGFDFLTKI